MDSKELYYLQKVYLKIFKLNRLMRNAKYTIILPILNRGLKCSKYINDLKVIIEDVLGSQKKIQATKSTKKIISKVKGNN